jgi:ribosomal protein S21
MASSSARPESKGKKRSKTVVGLSMAMSVLCSVASVVRILPRSSVETSSSTGDSTVATSISRSSSLKLPPLVAQQQQQQLSAAGKSIAASSSVEMTIADPSLQYANLMWFRGSYNAQVFVGEDEPADSVVRRFRKAVMMAGVIPECRRRRFFETPQDIVKRKQQNARRKKPR